MVLFGGPSFCLPQTHNLDFSNQRTSFLYSRLLLMFFGSSTAFCTWGPPISHEFHCRCHVLLVCVADCFLLHVPLDSWHPGSQLALLSIPLPLSTCQLIYLSLSVGVFWFTKYMIIFSKIVTCPFANLYCSRTVLNRCQKLEQECFQGVTTEHEPSLWLNRVYIFIMVWTAGDLNTK